MTATDEGSTILRTSVAFASLGAAAAVKTPRLPGINEKSSELITPPADAPQAPRPAIVSTAVHLVSEILKAANQDAGLRVPIFLLGAALVGKSCGEFMMIRFISALDENIVRRGSRTSYFQLLTKFLIWSAPVALASQLSGFLVNIVSNRLRSRLTLSIIQNAALATLRQPTEVNDSERLDELTGDAAQLASVLTQTLSDRFRRICDFILQFAVLSRRAGISAPLVMCIYLWLTSKVLTLVKSAKPAAAKKAADRENVLRRAVARLCRHKDSVAVWGGEKAEAANFARLARGQELARNERDFVEFGSNLTGALSSKVVGSALGFALVARPFLDTAEKVALMHSHHLDRVTPQVGGPLQYFWAGRVMYQLCSNFTQLLDDLNGDAATKVEGLARRVHQSVVSTQVPTPTTSVKTREGSVTLCDITVMSPTENLVLFKDLSIEIFPASLVLVTGPKSSGKSALLRVIMGSWPTMLGEVCRPASGVFCVPQKPYVVLESSLREQVIYPDPVSSCDNDWLMEVVKVAKLHHLFTAPSSKSSSLSDAEQQKLMLCRLLYHKPQFALLDDSFKGLDAEYAIDILRHLKKTKCAVVLVCNQSLGDLLKAKHSCDAELVLSTKQPPKHELTFFRETNQL